MSFAYYTAAEEMEFVLDAVEFVAEFGHRFLPLYDFDWRTGAWEPTGSDGILAAAEAALHGGRPLEDGRGGHPPAVAPPYAEYMRVAREIAAALPDESPAAAGRWPPPEGVDPKLVTFLV